MAGFYPCPHPGPSPVSTSNEGRHQSTLVPLRDFAQSPLANPSISRISPFDGEISPTNATFQYGLSVASLPIQKGVSLLRHSGHLIRPALVILAGMGLFLVI